MSARDAHEAVNTILSHECQLGDRKQSIREWIVEYGADQGVVLLRLTAGWSLRRALEEPLRDAPISPRRVRGKPRSSRFLGVTRHGSRKHRWYARISKQGKLIDLGTSENEMIAASLYNIASRNRDGIAARVNLI
ncbi:MAG: hypothetical protein DCC68_22530 [Planctomycetota bacterium]|nr:MAG: hypothetical protein DCC68_22530 [Planctomycetota bacterium]